LVFVADLEAIDWLNMYANTHNKNGRIEWPDGGCYLKQLYVVLEVWAIIAGEINNFRKEREK
jgi:hypothetical protein